MKTQFKPVMSIHYISLWTLTALFLCLQSVSFATTVSEVNDPVISVKSKSTDTRIDDGYISNQIESKCSIKYQGNEDAVFVKLFEKKIGRFMSLTQIPIKLINAFKNQSSSEQNLPAESVESAWSSNIKIDMNVGFLDDENTLYPGQYVAVKGHINKINILLVLVLTT